MLKLLLVTIALAVGQLQVEEMDSLVKAVGLHVAEAGLQQTGE